MKIHANAVLGPAGRLALVQAIESGMTQKAAAAAFCVAPATAHRWWHRRLDASTEEVQSGRWLLDGDTQKRICEWRRRTGWGPRLVAGKVGRHHSTVWKVLARHGISRPARAPREEARRYEWPCPGDLLHMDTSRYARFERPGHAVTGDRSQRSRKWMDPATRVGFDFCHAIVDDHSRLAQTNGKVERFHQTMAREWAYGMAYRSHHHRNTALPHWLKHYNETRPHSSVGGRPPISRVHNVRGLDT